MVAVEKEQITWSSRTIAAPRSLTALRYATAATPGGVMLESAATDEPSARYSIFAMSPARFLTLDDQSETDPFELLGQACRPWSRLEPRPELPFVGGWIGYLSYEAGRFVEPSAGWRRHSRLPVCQWAFYDAAVVHDAFTGQWHVVGVESPKLPAPRHRPSLAERLDALEELVETADRAAGEFRTGGGRERHSSEASAFGEWNFSREEYLAKVRRILEYIGAGDTFQVNLTQRMCCHLNEPPVAIYDRLCTANPAAYAAYIPVLCPGMAPAPRRNRTQPSTPLYPPAAVLSSSPELFLALRGGDVTTRPIKGTRPRGLTPDLDEVLALELTASEKERAELNMIIDLERNDLGRVCEYGSVRVVHDGEIEMLPTVIHRTATIVGRLRPDADAIDLLRATFPGGSITGAPKVRAMQIIDELEPEARGPYCGAIGYIGLDGDVQLNVAIRTMVAREAVSHQPSAVSQNLRGSDGTAKASATEAPGYEVSLHVGSGIVTDSDPAAEYEELQAKAAGMLAALRGGQTPSAAIPRHEEILAATPATR
jgi:para-aminobenzoate synthetase component I